MPRRTFLKIYCEAALEGLIHDLPAMVRGCYWTLMWRIGNDEFSDYGAFAVSLDPLLGYSDDQVAAKLNVERNEWLYAKKLLQIPRRKDSLPLLVVLDGEVLVLPQYSHFQPEYDRQKKYRRPYSKKLHEKLQQLVTAKVTHRRREEEKRKALRRGTTPIVDKDVDNLVNHLATEKDINQREEVADV